MALSEHEQDRILLQKVIQEGCMKSFAIIYGRYKPIIDAFIKKTDSTAEDISQIVFMRLLEGKCKYDGRSDVKAYLNGMALIILKEQTRSLSRMKHKHTQISEGRERIADGDRLNCPDEILCAREINEQQKNAIQDLSPKSRQAVKLVYEDGIPAARAAKMIQCDFDVFRQRLKYGLQCLSQRLNPDQDLVDLQKHKSYHKKPDKPDI